ncbi:hypothetical protein [Nitrosospira sp. NpAV]|uniref:hypothetical protein n=1 Tax=Nitrosospira sp. NpAV TaxID=58133 RepID=UPI0005A1B124|nr:hypothetical protein [Nitrosospira sp. NpAV]KIO49588.1 hypothetical protein SQ11_05520 [Nitrosospira sp. NpAV]
MDIRQADCPLGAKCEDVKTDGGKQYIARCPWYIKVAGVDTNTGKEVEDFGCAIAWMPTLMINTANESRKGVAATESFRNEMVKEGERNRQSFATLNNSPHIHNPMMVANSHPPLYIPMAISKEKLCE